MLSPEYWNSLPDHLVALWSQTESDILVDMARRISGFDLFTPSARHQMNVLEEMGLVRGEIVRRLSKLSGKTEQQLQAMMLDAGVASLRSDDEVYQRAGRQPLPLRADKHLQQVLQAGLEQTLGEFENLSRTTAQTATRQFERALDRAYMQIATGGMDASAAIRSAVKELSRQGIASITYPTGHTDYMDVAVRRAAITGVNQTLGRMQEARAREMGWDLMELTAHAGARPAHAVWQGQLVSLSGQPGYLTKEHIGYGTGAGFKGWNCNHDWRPYDPAMPRMYPGKLLEEYEAKNYSYKGQAMTEYEALQNQRQIERNIRRWKREYLAMDGAKLDTSQSARKLREWREREQDFLTQTGLKKQHDRQAVPGFGRSEAARAVRDVKRTVLTSAGGREIIQVKKTSTTGFPDSITQIESIRGGISRNYYGADRKWVKQVTNNGHGNTKKHPFGKRGEHAHDIIWDGDKIIGRPVRELTELERKENADIL